MKMINTVNYFGRDYIGGTDTEASRQFFGYVDFHCLRRAGGRSICTKQRLRWQSHGD